MRVLAQEAQHQEIVRNGAARRGANAREDIGHVEALRERREERSHEVGRVTRSPRMCRAILLLGFAPVLGAPRIRRYDACIRQHAAVGARERSKSLASPTASLAGPARREELIA